MLAPAVTSSLQQQRVPERSREARRGFGSSTAGQRACGRQPARMPAQASSLDLGLSLEAQPQQQQDQHLLRVLAATDLHVDYAENMSWCHNLDDQAHRRDVLMVSGDVSDELGALEEALGCLAAKFGAVFFTPGNHELWIREKDKAAGMLDSLVKLRHVLELCQQLGVHTQPRRLGNVWLALLFSWHHKSFDCEPDIPGVPPVSAWTIADYGACRWPQNVPGGEEPGSVELAQWFDGMNDTPAWCQLLATRDGCDVITLAHFLPHQALLPEKRFLYYPGLAKAVGSAPLAARLAALRPDLCLVGHTHFAWDQVVQGVRYIQAPLCSPLERRRRLHTVGFGVSMEQAQVDPLAARWLPLEVYRGMVPAGWEIQGLGAAAAASSGSGSSSGGSSSSSTGAAESQQQAQQQQQQQEQLQRWLDAQAVEGWQPLRHGAMAGPLQAHWSDHYASTKRQPENIVMAPWVSRLYNKRRQRAAHVGSRRGGSKSESDSG